MDLGDILPAQHPYELPALGVFTAGNSWGFQRHVFLLGLQGVRSRYPYGPPESGFRRTDIRIRTNSWREEKPGGVRLRAAATEGGPTGRTVARRKKYGQGPVPVRIRTLRNMPVRSGVAR